MQEPSINQKSLTLQPSLSPLSELATSCILYSAHNYPYTSEWLNNVLSKLVSNE